jgi:hypothetical protein
MTVTVTQVSSTTSAVTLSAADGSRTSHAIANTDPNRLYWLLGTGTPSATNYTDYLDEGESVSFTGADIVAAVQGIWTGDGAGHANVTTNTDPVSDSNGAFTTYGGLKSEIAAWLRPNMTPTADMTARIPVYVGLAEVDIRRELHLRALDQADTSLDIEDGVAAVPAGFLSVLSMTMTTEPYNQIRALPLDQLEKLDPTQLYDKPYYYTRTGSSFLFYPKTDATARLRFRRGVTPLSADADTNWILAAHPDVYLYGSLLHADRRLIGPRLGEWEKGYARALDGIRKLEMNLHSDAIIPQPSGFVV